MNISRRAAMGLVVAGTTGPSWLALSSPAQAQALSGSYIWGLHTGSVEVPSHTWTIVPWPFVVLNTTTVTVTPEGVWVFSAETANGIWAIVANVSWDNPPNVPAHRKLVRVPQQDVGTPQINQPAFIGAQTELWTPEGFSTANLADGSKGYQEQQVYIQSGVRPGFADQRIWIEAYQDSGVSLTIRFDGSNAPKTKDRPQIVGFQAPSFMAARMCDF